MYLLDTNVVSELRAKRPHPEFVTFWASFNADRAYLSVVTIGELEYGGVKLRRRDPEAATPLDDWLVDIRAEFANRILPVTTEVATRWGALIAKRPQPAADALIAATASVHGYTVITRNVADFEGYNLHVINPFDPR